MKAKLVIVLLCSLFFLALVTVRLKTREVLLRYEIADLEAFEVLLFERYRFSKSEVEKKAAAEAGAGAGAGGAIRGAAVGALIGEIASDDAGEGAAYGAAAGLIASRRRARAKRLQAEGQADAEVEHAKTINAEAAENFKKAFSVCLEAKEYMVKY